MPSVVIGSPEHFEEIRHMAGGPSDTEVTPEELQSYFEDAEDWVELGTGLEKDNLQITDRTYTQFKTCITFRASCMIRYGWRDKDNKAQEHCGEARRLLGEINDTSEFGTDEESTLSNLTSTEYRTAEMIASTSGEPGMPYKSPDFNF
ncbi:MAG TPA: hypothetical protein VGE97_03475 [Nitrososphaera sp.]|jgi:hypothetical protein